MQDANWWKSATCAYEARTMCVFASETIACTPLARSWTFHCTLKRGSAKEGQGSCSDGGFESRPATHKCAFLPRLAKRQKRLWHHRHVCTWARSPGASESTRKRCRNDDFTGRQANMCTFQWAVSLTQVPQGLALQNPLGRSTARDVGLAQVRPRPGNPQHGR